MKLFDFALDERFAARDYEGMIAAVADMFGVLNPPGDVLLDTAVPNPTHWRWGRIIIYCNGFRWVYCRGGVTRTNLMGFKSQATDSRGHFGVITELLP